jgi:hypothetical protein
MKSSMSRTWLIAATALGMAFGWTPVAAQQSKTVGGLIINFGLMPAEIALRADGHRDAHPLHPPGGSQHFLITLDDEKSGARIGDAEVAVEVTDPHGRVDKKALLHTQSGGCPDYSELFVFGWSGEYSIRVTITRPAAKPIETRFKVNHTI